MNRIGIIGGSGLDNPDLLENPEDRDFSTKFGKPSSPLKLGTIQGKPVALMARHGREHTIPPTQINNRANILALQEAGCSHIIATTAVGSLKEKIQPGDLVILDQFIDFTKHRVSTFHESFEPGKMQHAPMADPFDNEIRDLLISSCESLQLPFHTSGTVVTIEGPRFSTRAESHMFRSWNADVINMSTAPECALANEAGIPYSAVAMSTDYDCWKEEEEPVSWEAVLKVFKANVDKVTNLLLSAIPRVN